MGVGPFPRSTSKKVYDWVEKNATKKDKAKFYHFVQQWSVNFKKLDKLNTTGFYTMYYQAAQNALFTQTEWEDLNTRDRASNILTAFYRRRLEK